jgi:alpha-ribazole phosphatase
MATLWLVRHAATADNLGGTVMGRRDPEPLPEGLEAAAALRLRPTAVVTSPARRALRTAEALAPAGVHVRIDERWRERDLGAWEGQRKSELPAAALTATGAIRLEASPPGGEPFDAFEARVRAALDDVPDGAVVVAHNGSLRLARYVLGTPLAEASAAAFAHVEPLRVSRASAGP